MEKVDRQLRYRQIREILHECGELTAKEVAKEMKYRGYTPTDERAWSAPRLTELYYDGELEITGKKRDILTNKWVWMYRLTKEEDGS